MRQVLQPEQRLDLVNVFLVSADEDLVNVLNDRLHVCGAILRHELANRFEVSPIIATNVANEYYTYLSGLESY